MKAKIILMALAVVGIGVAACSDDDDINIGKENKEVEAAFYQKYPDAERVSWEEERGYFVAKFWRSDLKAEVNAWFDAMAMWLFTETDIRYDALPQAVKNAFEASEYSDWQIDDVDMVERPEMETVYVLEVDKGKEEYGLFFSADGILLKAIPDAN